MGVVAYAYNPSIWEAEIGGQKWVTKRLLPPVLSIPCSLLLDPLEMEGFSAESTQPS